MRTEKWGICPTCGVETNLTLHHALWPKKRYANHPQREKRTILLCWECHQAIHDYWKLRGDETSYGIILNPGRRRAG